MSDKSKHQPGESENPPSSSGDDFAFKRRQLTIEVIEENAPSSPDNDFARQAEEASPGLLAEFWDFLKHEKKWWLTPIILVLLILAAFVIFSPAAAPFIYPLF